MEARRSYESVVDVFLQGMHACAQDSGRGRRCRSSDQPLLLRGVYLDVFVALGLHLRPVTLRACTRPRPRSFAWSVTCTTGIVIHGTETNVLVLRTPRSCLNRGVVMTATAEPTSNSLAYYYRCRGSCTGCSSLLRIEDICVKRR